MTEKMYFEGDVLCVEKVYVNSADLLMRKPNPREEICIQRHTKEEIEKTLFNLYRQIRNDDDVSDAIYDLIDDYEEMLDMFEDKEENL